MHLLSARNHGLSDRAPEMPYEAMVADTRQYLVDVTRRSPGNMSTTVLGHSMGGKTAMLTALDDADADVDALFHRLVVADIAPRDYASYGEHLAFVEGMRALPLDSLGVDRRAADRALAAAVPDPGVRAFLLSSLVIERDASAPGGARFKWQLNLGAQRHCGSAGTPAPSSLNSECLPLFVCVRRVTLQTCSASPRLSVRCEAGQQIVWLTSSLSGPHCSCAGGRSDYVTDDDVARARASNFPDAQLVTIGGAGHWLHAEKPDEVFTAVRDFVL